MSLRYLSICSGIEAASVAWEGLGWTPVGFSEIDKFASAVLAERFGSNMPGEPYPGNAPPNFGDFTDIALSTLGPVDLLVGGTPCQAFSFAGKRLSLEDARGNLTLAFAVLAHELAGSHGCRNALWENVPGVLSTDDNAFGCFLGALVGADDALLPSPKPAGKRGNDLWTWSKDLGDIRPAWPCAGMVAGPRARAAWRVLDAQYFRLAQRRERVFVVVDLGGGADPAAVLFERQGLRGNSPPRREEGQKPAPTVAGGSRSRGGYSHDDVPLTPEPFVAEVASTLPAGANSTGGERQPGMGAETAATYLIAHTLRGEGFDASEAGTGRGIPLVPVALRGHSDYGDGLPSLRAEGGDCGGGSEALIAFSSKDTSVNVSVGVSPTLQAAAGRGHGAGLAIAFSCKDHGADAASDLAPTLRAMGHGDSHPNAGGQVAVAVSVSANANGLAWESDVFPTLQARAQSGSSNQFDGVRDGWAVRRLTPRECARLQGFPDHHSRIPWRGKSAELCPDGPQYKTYGNSMAVPVMRWIGERLAYDLARAA